MTTNERRLTRLEPETRDDGSVHLVLIQEPKDAATERLLNTAARSVALQAFRPASPVTIRRPVPVQP